MATLKPFIDGLLAWRVCKNALLCTVSCWLLFSQHAFLVLMLGLKGIYAGGPARPSGKPVFPSWLEGTYIAKKIRTGKHG